MKSFYKKFKDFKNSEFINIKKLEFRNMYKSVKK